MAASERYKFLDQYYPPWMTGRKKHKRGGEKYWM
jgi:hypothetical protein